MGILTFIHNHHRLVFSIIFAAQKTGVTTFKKRKIPAGFKFAYHKI